MTVVATGLGGHERPNVVVDHAPRVTVPEPVEDYRKLDRPTVMRHQASRRHERSLETAEAPNLDYLDIPAFLRRQAD